MTKRRYGSETKNQGGNFSPNPEAELMSLKRRHVSMLDLLQNAEDVANGNSDFEETFIPFDFLDESRKSKN